jgi:eukaryotic-like serine/threonine-protein kinase
LTRVRFGDHDTAVILVTKGVTNGFACDFEGGKGMETSSPAPGLTGRRFGRYELVAPLGRGGMGEVYAARHVDLGTRAAVKVIHSVAATDSDATRRVLKEGRATAAIRHPNVVAVLDVGTEQGTPYLVMELLEGEDLAQRLERDGPPALAEAIALLLPILAAVVAAHDAGIVHRDLKPSNVLLARRRDAVEPVVVDFGLSTWSDPPSDMSTSSDVVAGTPQYMAPERLRGMRGTEPSSDLYALGVIAYECLTGGTPFWSEDRYELMHAIMTAQTVPPSTLNPRVPPGLDGIVLRAMARDPAARFRSVREFGAALLPFASEPIRQRYAKEFGGDGLSTGGSGDGFAGTVRQELAPRRPRIMVPVAAAVVGTVAVVVALSSRGRSRAAEQRRLDELPAVERQVETTQETSAIATQPAPAATADRAISAATTADLSHNAPQSSPAGSSPVSPPSTMVPSPRRTSEPKATAPSSPNKPDASSERAVERGTANIPIIE